jgi:hypothetical protein
MLNDVLAVGVAGAVIVVIATILGAVELLSRPSLLLPAHELPAVGLAAAEDEISRDKNPENSRRKNDPFQPIQHRELLTTILAHHFRCR